MELVELRSFEDYHEYQKLHLNERIQVEKKIIKEFYEYGHDFILGYCEVCEKASKFKIKKVEKKKINLRGSLFCENCNLNSRKRFMLSFLKKFVRDSDSNLSIFMYEQITRLFKFAKNIQNIELRGSEFLGYDKKPGQIINNIQNEDAMNLSFDDNSFDVIVSNDVFEHLPNIDRALNEAYRILKNSGLLLMSIPFLTNNTTSIKRATLENGKIKHLLAPTHHQNPIEKKDGALVFYDYGWDFLDYLKKAGFNDVYMLGYYDLFYGYLGSGLQFIFIAKK